jgi:hypothetical protein
MKKWLKVAGITVLGGCVAIPAFFVIAIVACLSYGSIKEWEFEQIHVGDSETTVIAMMGSPRHIETAGALYALNFSGVRRKCEGACARRFWYHNRVCLDEEWFIEFDKDAKVIKSAHITSP